MSPYEERTRSAQAHLEEDEALVLFPGPNLYYFTGFATEPSERHLLYILGPDTDPTLIVPDLYAEQVSDETWLTDIRSYDDDEAPMALVRSAIQERGLADGCLRVDPAMWAQFTRDLRESLPRASVVLAESLLTDLRIHKDNAELGALRRAASVADSVSTNIRALGSDVVGRTETELATEIEDRLADHGGTELAFPVIVGSGPNGARPHHTHGDRTIQSGDPVVLDFGAYIDRYPGDQTRTIVFDGEPPDGYIEAHEAVGAAQTAAFDAVEPGVTTGTVDAAARTVLEDRGYGEAFIHRTGHGVGLSVHEAPYIVAGGERTLEPGMVFSIEPGVYISGEFGVRIEDLVVVTQDGAERLNDSPREWQPTINP